MWGVVKFLQHKSKMDWELGLLLNCNHNMHACQAAAFECSRAGKDGNQEMCFAGDCGRGGTNDGNSFGSFRDLKEVCSSSSRHAE